MSTRWAVIAIATLALLPHLGALGNPFVHDDWGMIVENPLMAHPQAAREILGSGVWDYRGSIGASNYYRPLPHLVNHWIYQAVGLRPAWFRFFNLLLHAGVSLLVFAVVRTLSANKWIALAAGLLFAVHPLHTEVVAWISCAPELLAAFFSLLTIWLYLREPRHWVLLPAMAVTVLLAQLSKEVAVMAPLVLAGYELLLRPSNVLDRWREFCALGAGTLVYLGARVQAIGALMPIRHESAISWPSHILTALALLWRYVLLLIWPVNLNFFRYDAPSASVLEPAVIGGALVAAAIGGLAYCLWRDRAKLLLLMVLLFILTLLPVFQLPYLAIERLVVERSAYLPSVGFVVLAAALLTRLRPRLSWTLLGIVLACYSLRSGARMSDWRDEVAMFQEGLARSPRAADLHLNYAASLLRHNRPVEALAALSEAVRLRPNYPDAYNNLGRAYSLLDRPDHAVPHYVRAAELFARDGHRDFSARAWSNAGIAHRAMGQNRAAIAAYRRALDLDGSFAEAHNNLGYALLLEGEVEEAEKHLRVAVERDPASWRAHANLGLAHARARRYEAALQSLGQAERLSPANPEVQARIALVRAAASAEGLR